MNDFVVNSATIGVVISIFAYQIGAFLKKKIKKDYINPLLIAVVLVILFLVVFDVDYDSYNQSAKYISYLLTPATVSLAIPLYQQIELLKKNFGIVIVGITIGVFTSMISILLLSMLFQLDHTEYVTLLPKSITTAIGMDLSEELGGYVAISVAAINITAILGNITVESLCKLFRIKHAISRGLAIGTCSHASGTAKAMEMGQIEGAMSGLSIAVAGLLTVILAPIFATFY